MTTSREDAGRRLYGPSGALKPEGAKPAQAKETSRRGAARLMYGSGYGGALASYFDRREAKLRDDREGLEISRRERQQIEAFARKRGIPASDLQGALVVMLEHEAHPKSEQVIQERWVSAFEALRIECGGREPAHKLLNNYATLTSELTKEVPTLADRAGRSGAANDVRIIKALARYGEQQPTAKE